MSRRIPVVARSNPRLSRGGAAREDESSSSWACPACTFAGNPALFLSCTVCHGERPIASGIAPSAAVDSTLAASTANNSGSGGTTTDAKTGQRHAAVVPPLSGTALASSCHGASRPKELEPDPDDDSSVELLEVLPEMPQSRGAAPSSKAASPSSSVLAARGTRAKIPRHETDRDGKTGTELRSTNRHTVLQRPSEAGVDDEEEAESRRLPPAHTAVVRNLSDPEYCCVWAVEVLDRSYRPDVARLLLAAVARHVNPVLRARGWRVKRLLESCSTQWIGLCTANGRNDADAASVNIQLNLRVQPSAKCRQFRAFPQVLGVMLHEITHTSIGLEDIHPPAFWELLREIRKQYRALLGQGEVAAQARQYDDDNFYKCHETTVVEGRVQTVCEAALQLDRLQHLGLQAAVEQALGTGTGPTPPSLGSSSPDEDLDGDHCGASRRHKRRWRRRNRAAGGGGPSSSRPPRQPPLLKGARLVDGRTKAGKVARLAKGSLTSRELAARAALSRLGQWPATGERMAHGDKQSADALPNGADESEAPSSGSSCWSEDEDSIAPHVSTCGCRSCQWDQLMCQRTRESG